jgi:anti-sigma regulatory factor (Ser/Thr protein kinase)
MSLVWDPGARGRQGRIDAEVVLHLDGHAGSVPAARRTVQGWLLDRHVPSAVVERVRLVVTELADNAVRHARTAFRLRVTIEGDVVRVEVADGNDHLPAASRPAPDAVSGRGLWLVSRLAHRWGAHRDGDGKVVWATVTVVAPPPAGDVEGAGEQSAVDRGGGGPVTGAPAAEPCGRAGGGRFQGRSGLARR